MIIDGELDHLRNQHLTLKVQLKKLSRLEKMLWKLKIV
jgi:hypothetical protein